MEMQRRLKRQRIGPESRAQRLVMVIRLHAPRTVLQVLFNSQTADHVQFIVEIAVEQVLYLVTVQRRPPWASAVRQCCSRLRARARRDMTVPSGTSVMAAISLYDSPSSSRSTTTSRNSTGKASRACWSIC